MIYVLSIMCLIFPIICIYAYRLGIKDGRALKQDKPLEKLINIPKPISKEAIKRQKEFEEKMKRLNNYTGGM